MNIKTSINPQSDKQEQIKGAFAAMYSTAGISASGT
ncbi:uncharacterized protein METZ01_LOCUS155207 [marine metagenome]|uniref:Uncharacterized protein n=1 Tax=marine metagenome TaxID=408172 RepID=A0A382AMW8_9ZZZZ